MTTKEDETRLSIVKLRYELMLNNWNELNRKHRALLHVSGLVLTAIIICMSFINESTNSLIGTPLSEDVSPLVFLFFLMALSAILLSICKLLDFKFPKNLSFSGSEVNMDMIEYCREEHTLSLTKIYEKIHDDISRKYDKLDKNIMFSIYSLASSIMLLIGSLVIIFLTKISIL